MTGICSYDLVGNATSAKPRPERADFALDLGKGLIFPTIESKGRVEEF
jgi:hypothetical protein